MDPTGKPVVILTGEHAGQEGVCVGKADETGKWAVSLDMEDSMEILRLEFETEFKVMES